MVVIENSRRTIEANLYECRRMLSGVNEPSRTQLVPANIDKTT